MKKKTHYRILEGEEEGQENLIKDIMDENLPSLEKEIDIWSQGIPKDTN
jgi:hypothetical protein